MVFFSISRSEKEKETGGHWLKDDGPAVETEKEKQQWTQHNKQSISSAIITGYIIHSQGRKFADRQPQPTGKRRKEKATPKCQQQIQRQSQMTYNLSMQRNTRQDVKFIPANRWIGDIDDVKGQNTENIWMFLSQSIKLQQDWTLKYGHNNSCHVDRHQKKGERKSWYISFSLSFLQSGLTLSVWLVEEKERSFSLYVRCTKWTWVSTLNCHHFPKNEKREKTSFQLFLLLQLSRITAERGKGEREEETCRVFESSSPINRLQDIHN